MVVPSSHLDILDKKGFAHWATTGPDGEPHSSPVWYDWDGEQILISQTTQRQKYRNVQKDPRIALSITDPDNPYRYLEVRGEVVSIEIDEDNAFINKMAKKYLGKDVYPWHGPGDQRVVVTITPKHTSVMG